MGGPERFVVDIEELGLQAEQRGPIVIVALDVAPAGSSGLHQVGTDPPADFPNVAPHWLHLRRGLILCEDPGRASELGDEWWRWSRAHPKWTGGANAARLWLAHARSLLLGAKTA